MKTYIPTIAKSLLAGGIAFTGAVAVGYVSEGMSPAEWWLSASAGLVALGAVWGVPNASTTQALKPATHPESGDPYPPL